jgi:hypothetical protein
MPAGSSSAPLLRTMPDALRKSIFAVPFECLVAVATHFVRFGDDHAFGGSANEALASLAIGGSITIALVILHAFLTVGSTKVTGTIARTRVAALLPNGPTIFTLAAAVYYGIETLEGNGGELGFPTLVLALIAALVAFSLLLLDDVVQVLALPNHEFGAVLGIVIPDPGLVRSALVDVDDLGNTVVLDRAREEPPCRTTIAFGGQQEVDRVALFIHGTIPVTIFPADLDIGFVQAPTLADGTDTSFALPFTKGFLQHRDQLDDPALNRGMIDEQAALLHHLFEIAQTQGVGDVPPHAEQHDVQ